MEFVCTGQCSAFSADCVVCRGLGGLSTQKSRGVTYRSFALSLTTSSGKNTQTTKERKQPGNVIVLCARDLLDARRHRYLVTSKLHPLTLLVSLAQVFQGTLGTAGPLEQLSGATLVRSGSLATPSSVPALQSAAIFALPHNFNSSLPGSSGVTGAER